MSYFISSLYVLWVILISTVLFCIAAVIRVITSPFDKKLIILNFFSHFWGALFFWSNPFWSLSITGKEYLPKNRPVVFIANHLSTIDVLVLSCLFTHFKWVSKIENFHIPFIGWSMYLNRYVAIKRGGIRSIKSMMSQSKQHLTNGSPIFIFPEGSRSHDGRLKPFKTGAFILAQEANVDIIPIVLKGSNQALPKNSLFFQGHHEISIQILPPISVKEQQQRSAKEVATLAYQLIKSAQ